MDSPVNNIMVLVEAAVFFPVHFSTMAWNFYYIRWLIQIEWPQIY